MSGIAGLALTAGCAKPHASNCEAATDFPGYIDAHSHVWSSDTELFPLGSWAKKDAMSPAEFTAEQLLETALPFGVERAVLIQHSPYFGYDSSYLIDCRRRFPGVFSIVGMIDERKPDLSRRLSDAVALGVRGIRISPTIHGDRTPVASPKDWLTVPAMQALWKVAAELRVAMCPIVSAEFLSTLDTMCAQFPETVCVIDHLGHVHESKEDRAADLLCLARHRNAYVKVSGFYKAGAQSAGYDGLLPLIRRAVEAFGPERLMWGSDCPYQLRNGHTYSASISLIRDRLDSLAASDRRAILRGTAERIFFS